MSGHHETPGSSENNLPGILLMVIGVFLMSVMDVLAKFLVEADYSALQIITIRGWIISLSLLGWLGFRRQLGSLRTRRARHHAARSILGFGATILFFTALGEMPLTDAIVILFASPFFMTALSIPLLKETVGPYRWVAIGIGFIGVVIVLQPGGGTFQIASMYVLTACLMFSLIQIMIRWMSQTEPAIRIVFYFSATTAIAGSFVLPFVWKPMPLEDGLIIFAMSSIAMVAQIIIAKALASAPISVISPFKYSSLIWVTLFGYFIWGDFPSNHVWLGAGIIVTSGIYMVHRERLNRAKGL